MKAMDRHIEHRSGQKRFQCIEEGSLCVLDYELADGTMTITHTGVPPAVGGRGIAADLTRRALDHARAQGWRVRPSCSYAAAYIRRHAEYAGLLA